MEWHEQMDKTRLPKGDCYTYSFIVEREIRAGQTQIQGNVKAQSQAMQKPKYKKLITTDGKSSHLISTDGQLNRAFPYKRYSQ